MSYIFPKWTNRLPVYIIIAALLVATAVTAGVWYYFTPKYARVGYQPIQPVPFPHSVHADQLGIDCRYCHSGVEKSWYSNIPAAGTCMNCHNQVLKEDPRLAPIRESAQTGDPVRWVQIHRTPDFVFFNHAVHVNRGFSCVECHGPINKMDEVYHAKPFSMTFCLDCHRDPAARIRDLDKITDLDWKMPGRTPEESAQLQKAHGEQLVKAWNVQSLENCSSCHR